MEKLGSSRIVNSFESLIRRYDKAFDRLESWGLRIAPASRLRGYADRLRKAEFNPTGVVDATFVEQSMFDLRELDEITEIVESMAGSPANTELAKLRMIHRGAEHPDADKGGSARDTQYELFLASLFRRAGIQVAVGEPDAVIKWSGREFPVEAKRPRSVERFDARVREAVSQLDGQTSKGIVAISLDMILRPREHHLDARRSGPGPTDRDFGVIAALKHAVRHA